MHLRSWSHPSFQMMECKLNLKQVKDVAGEYLTKGSNRYVSKAFYVIVSSV